MEEESATDDMPRLTCENAGKGLAFLGMLIFGLTVLFYLLSRGQPDQYHLFADVGHILIMSIISLALVIGGYILTKFNNKIRTGFLEASDRP